MPAALTGWLAVRQRWYFHSFPRPLLRVSGFRAYFRFDTIQNLVVLFLCRQLVCGLGLLPLEERLHYRAYYDMMATRVSM